MPVSSIIYHWFSIKSKKEIHQLSNYATFITIYTKSGFHSNKNLNVNYMINMFGIGSIKKFTFMMLKMRTSPKNVLQRKQYHSSSCSCNICLHTQRQLLRGTRLARLQKNIDFVDFHRLAWRHKVSANRYICMQIIPQFMIFVLCIHTP